MEQSATVGKINSRLDQFYELMLGDSGQRVLLGLPGGVEGWIESFVV